MTTKTGNVFVAVCVLLVHGTIVSVIALMGSACWYAAAEVYPESPVTAFFLYVYAVATGLMVVVTGIGCAIVVTKTLFPEKGGKP